MSHLVPVSIPECASSVVSRTNSFNPGVQGVNKSVSVTNGIEWHSKFSEIQFL